MTITTALVLAGGLGTRLRPVTYEIPKPMIPIRGKPLTEHVIDKLRESGIKTVYLSIGYMSEKVIEYFTGKDFGVKINFLVEKEPLGTGGCFHMLTAEQRLRDFSGDFIVLNGDDLFDLDFTKMLEFHHRNRALATIALAEVQDVSLFGVAELKDSRILRFVEKPRPQEAPSHLVSGGYYIFSNEMFGQLPQQARFMLEKDVFPKVAQLGRLYGYIGDGPWMTTNTFEQWEYAMKNWRVK